MQFKISAPAGFLLLETVLAVFILSAVAGTTGYLLGNLNSLYLKTRGHFLAANLAGYQTEKILAADFDDIVPFRTSENPADDWSREITRAALKEAAGQISVEEINTNLKKVTVAVFYQLGEKTEKSGLETVVVR